MIQIQLAHESEKASDVCWVGTRFLADTWLKIPTFQAPGMPRPAGTAQWHNDRRNGIETPVYDAWLFLTDQDPEVAYCFGIEEVAAIKAPDTPAMRVALQAAPCPVYFE